MANTFFRCPTCGNTAPGYSVYRGACGHIVCGRCAQYNYCPLCNGPLTWRDEIGTIG